MSHWSEVRGAFRDASTSSESALNWVVAKIVEFVEAGIDEVGGKRQRISEKSVNGEKSKRKVV